MKKRLSIFLLLLFAVSGCSTVKSWTAPLNPFADDEETSVKTEEANPMTLAVNPYLWQASLDKLAFMPLVSTDSKGGVIITDWKAMSNEPDEQFKVIVTISTRELRADGVRAEVFERIRRNGKWQDKQPDERLSDELEKGILYRARDLFRRDLMSR